MSGNGPPTGTPRGTKPTQPSHAASREIRAVGARRRATTPASPASASLARCSRAARTSAPPTTAAAIGPQRATPSPSTPRRAISAFDASSELQGNGGDRHAAGDAPLGAVLLVVAHVDDEGHLVD